MELLRTKSQWRLQQSNRSRQDIAGQADASVLGGNDLI